MRSTMIMAIFAIGLLALSASDGIAGDTGKAPVSPEGKRQELDWTLHWLKNTIESTNITLNPLEPEIGLQYYSHYSFNNDGCLIKFSYDFNYYERMSHVRKTTRLGASFNLKDIGTPVAAPFYLTHIETHLYAVTGNSFRIPVADTEAAEQIADRLNLARRLCSGINEQGK